MSGELDPNKLVVEIADKFVKDTITQVYETGMSVIKIPYDKLKISNAFKNYVSLVFERYSKAKSFLIRNQSTPLREFYIPQGIRSGNTTYPEATISTTTFTNNFGVITGVAGSGKTLMMRHLFLDTLTQKEKIPIFIELRKLNSTDKSLFDLIIETLSENKFVSEESFIKKAFEKGRFALLLDGFDEVSLEVRPKLIKEIHKFTKNYEQSVIIISSRPDNEFSGWQDFTVWEIEDLNIEQACELVNKPKIPFANELKRRFIKDLRERLYRQHKSFLSNPLLLSIMLLTYEERADIPNKLSIFYQQAYEVLFQKHDALKPDFIRPRYTNLDIRDFEKVFSAFSIQSYDNQQLEFSKSEALAYIENCKKMQVINVEFYSEKYLKDSREAVCLLIDDGLSIKFTHRSFQEYFTAKFISEAQEKTQEKLLNRYQDRFAVDEVIRLLHEMNPDIVERFFILPMLEKLIKKINIVTKVNLENYKTFLVELSSYFNFSITPTQIISWGSNKSNFPAEVLTFIVRAYSPLIAKTNSTFTSSLKKINISQTNINISDFIEGKAQNGVRVPTEEIIKDEKLVSELATNFYYSLPFLTLIIQIKKVLEEKHQKKDASLHEILNL